MSIVTDLLSKINPNMLLLLLGIFVFILLFKYLPDFLKSINKFGSVKIDVGKFSATLSNPESVKQSTDKNQKEINDLRYKIEEQTRITVSRQVIHITPFLNSLKPIFKRLAYLIINDAIQENMNFQKQGKKILGYKTIEQVGDVNNFDDDTSAEYLNYDEIKQFEDYYKYEETATYVHKTKTRLAINLVETSANKIISDLRASIIEMLINNNIGKSKEDIRKYLKSRIENVIGIVRNDLCDCYNSLGTENLFDTHKYWSQIGIEYPEDWLEDKMFFLLVNCMKLRYIDFED